MEFIDLQAQRSRLGTRLDTAMQAVLDHGRFIMGPEVAAFEQELGDHTGAPHVVSCANGTDALVLALRALGTAPGDHVVVPSFTFAATAEAVALVGAIPVFVDVDVDSFNVTVDAAVQAVAEYDAVGVITVDLFGLPAPSAALQTSLPQGVWVLADAAQSIGGRCGNEAVGTLVDVTTTSFFPAKPLGCYGDGGAVLTSDEALADVMRSLRVHGKGSHKYDNERIGTNSRLDTLQAAVLRCKLEVLEDEMGRRQDVAARYAEGLGEVVTVPRVPHGARSAWAQYTIRIDRRDEVQAALQGAGIPSVVYYPRPLHTQTAYRDFPTVSGGCPVSASLSGTVLSLPMHPYLEPADQDRVIEVIVSSLT